MDPLAQLKDISTPEQISQFPIALGWWLLLALLLLSLLTFFLKLKQYKKVRKNQRKAIAQITKNTEKLETMRILKWAAMAYFPRHEVASLSGNDFSTYLAEKLPINDKDKFIKQTKDHWQSLYQKNSDEQIAEEFNQAAVLWLNKALPPRKIKGVKA